MINSIKNNTVRYISDFFDFNSATLSGCIDIIVIEHADGSLSSTPFHVRFGKLKVFKSEHKVIDIVVNGKNTGIKMRLGKSGEAYFIVPKEDAMTSLQKKEHMNDLRKDVEDNMNNQSEKALDDEYDCNVDDDLDDLYKGVKFFEDAPKSRADSYTEDEEKTVEENFEEGEVNEAGELDDVIKMKSEEGYKKIINDLESQDSKKKQEQARKSRFAWLWGKNEQLEDAKLDAKVRVRSKSETGIEPLPSLSIDNKLEEKDLVKAKSKPSDDEGSPIRHTREGLFSRFLKLFRSKEKGNDKDAILFSDGILDQKKLNNLAQVDPKSGDTGVDSHEEKEQVVSLDDFMKDFMEFAGDENTGMSRALKEHYNWKNEKAQLDKTEKQPNEENVEHHRSSDSPKRALNSDRKEPLSPENLDSDEEAEADNHIKDFTDRSMDFKKKSQNSEIAQDEKIDDNLNVNINKCLSEGNLQPQEMENAKLEELQVPLSDTYGGKAKSEGFIEKKRKRKYKKTLFMSSDELKQLNLRYGKNEITYVCDSTGSNQESSSRIFFWNYKVKIVISDVDGTITKSDVLGHILPRFGKDWSHHGVAELYTNIRSNGYEFLYLTSRAIGMADSTRSYLESIEQDDLYKLPDGPCIMSPDRLMHSFKREVIDRKPHLFKIAALWNVKNLFRGDKNPFYAGFGNRETDAISYRAVGISFKKIFIINPQSEVVILQSMYKKTYQLINEIVDQVFPPVCNAREKPNDEEDISPIEMSKFNDLNFWNPKPCSLEDLEEQGEIVSYF